MRHLVVLFALADIATKVLGQVNIPFPDSSAMWVHVYETMIVPPPLPVFEVASTSNFCINGADTLIAGHAYAKIDHCAGGYIGALRSDSGAVHFIPADSLQEFLLYDFTVQVGDTLHDVYTHESLTTGYIGTPTLLDVVVGQVTSDPNDNGRITIWLSPPGGGLYGQWVEGVGCVAGLFAFSAMNVSNYNFYLSCLSHTDTIRWMVGGTMSVPGNCSPWYMDVHEPRKPWAQVYPNPTEAMLFVPLEHHGQRADVFITDAQGRRVPALVMFEPARMVIDLRSMQTGTYLVHMRSANSAQVQQVVKW